jgi:hypothetical protein
LRFLARLSQQPARGVEPTEHSLHAGEDGEQQDVQALHRPNERLVRWRMVVIDQIRSILGERSTVVAPDHRCDWQPFPD